MRVFSVLTLAATLTSALVGASLANEPVSTPATSQTAPAADVLGPPPADQSVVAAPAGLRPDEQEAVAPYLPDPKDQKRVADVRSYLVSRATLAQATGEGEDVDKATAKVLIAMSTVPQKKRLDLLKALDKIWPIRADYFDQLTDSYASVDRYIAWLGPERYDLLKAQRDYFAQNKKSFMDWRDQQPPSAWQFGEVLVRTPPTLSTQVDAAQPAPRAAAPVPALAKTYFSASELKAFPRSSRRGRAGKTQSAGRIGASSSSPRILLPNANSGKGSAPAARKRVNINSSNY